MTLRSRPARWFEILTPRAEATAALKALADTGAVELQSHSTSAESIATPALQAVLTEYRELARSYRGYWPELPPATPDLDHDRAAASMQVLRTWADAARPVIARLEELDRERSKLGCLQRLLEQAPGALPSPARLAAAGPTLGCGLFRMPADTWPEGIPAGVIVQRVMLDDECYLLALGPRSEYESLASALTGMKAEAVPFPEGLAEGPGDGSDDAAGPVLEDVRGRLAEHEQEERRLRERLQTLNEEHGIAKIIGSFELLDWMTHHVPSFPSSESFAWITGWTSDADGESIHAALDEADIRYLMRLCEPPDGYPVPMLLSNPSWARPFEFFARQLGTPGGEETDPSMIVAVLAPLMFGFMFGDVGHGAVLFVAGLFLYRKIPQLGILIPGGIASMCFGVVFGSVFAREDLIPALWLHPLEHPLTVLGTSLGFGIIVLLLGLVLDAVQWGWMGQWSAWWRRRVGLMVAFLAIVASFFEVRFLYVAVAGFAWYVFGEAFARAEERTPAALGQAAGEFLESLFQLAVNTVSFVRVGAFALAHAGLGVAVVGMAEATGNMTGMLIVLALGNLLIIVLEGLIVGIQTTRLLLFEFFIRFLKATGRPFRPLPPPELRTPTNGSKA
jgi:V/A-type H+-transporting ATPase subunit I